MFDIIAVEKEAKAEIAADRAQTAKKKIKDKLRQISAAEQVVSNLRGEYALLLKDIGSDV